MMMAWICSSKRRRGKLSDSENILKEELTGFADRWVVKWEIKKKKECEFPRLLAWAFEEQQFHLLGESRCVKAMEWSGEIKVWF